jgi:glycosyltransferase involved in cell wall biosynthesis
MTSGVQPERARAEGEEEVAAGIGDRTQRLHVCFVAPSVYPILANLRKVELVGGAEVQQAILARLFRADGHRVSLLTADYGQPAKTECDGIEVYRLPNVGQRGIKGLRFVYPHMTDVVKGLRAIDPEILYMRAASGLVAGAAWYARHHAKKFVYACASDAELYRKAPWPRNKRDAFAFRWGLRHADGILVQNASQQRLLKENFGKDGCLLPNVYFEAAAGRGTSNGHVLWVGTVKPVKRPELFLELARQFPERQFAMVGGPEPDAVGATCYYEHIKQAARKAANVEFVGYVPFADVGHYFDKACIFINTSTTEGFPNTFLQAWLRGVPSLSFVSPMVRPDSNGTIACANLAEMARHVGRLTSDPQEWRLASQACERHFNETHSPDATVRRYRRYFRRLAAGKVPR